MTSVVDEELQNNDPNKHFKPTTFHNMYCKTGINDIGMTRIVLKPNSCVAMNYENTQKGKRVTFKQSKF